MEVKTVAAILGYLHRRILLRILDLCVNIPTEECLFFRTDERGFLYKDRILIYHDLTWFLKLFHIVFYLPVLECKNSSIRSCQWSVLCTVLSTLYRYIEKHIRTGNEWSFLWYAFLTFCSQQFKGFLSQDCIQGISLFSKLRISLATFKS